MRRLIMKDEMGHATIALAQRRIIRGISLTGMKG